MYPYCYRYCCCYCSAGIAALGKIFVGQLVETAVTIMEERGEAYPGKFIYLKNNTATSTE
jgi:hTAFII28-like protein conserved region